MGLDFDALTKFTSQVGFPIVVAIWHMKRTDRKLDRLIELMLAIVVAKKVRIPPGENDNEGE